MVGKRPLRISTISLVSSIDSVVCVTKARLSGFFGAKVCASSAVSINVTAPAGTVTLIETAEDAATFTPKDPNNLAFVTQTTLSIDDTAEIVALLKERFPNINGPHKEDICYATTNRQLAVKKVAPVVDALIVVGAPNSSNSQRLREVAEREGCPIAVLAQRASDIDWKRFEGIKSLGITAGASAPEVIVEEIMGAFAERFTLHVETVSAAEENEFFPLPRSLRPEAAAE